MSELKDRIAEALRRHPKLSQADVARACGVKSPSVTGWLNGKTKSLQTEPARLAAKLFGCDQNWLAAGVGSPNWGHGPTNPVSIGPSQPETSLTWLVDAIAALPPARWASVRAQLDQLASHPEMRNDVLAELLTLLQSVSTKRVANAR